MALNPFFLQGSQTEQRLVQELINEQLRMYGVDVTYIPRKFVRRNTVIREIESSKFDDNYIIEAYVNTYEGYSGSGDILTKFGMSLRDELTVTISKERFEDFISPFLEAESDDEIVLSSRPREGDLIYFPLGQRLFEVKFVEHEDPFYQLGKNYVYQLKCELFEYEDEVIDTSIDEIDTQVQDEGYITTLTLLGIGATASASALINSGYVREIFLNNDGSGYTSTPVIRFTDAPEITGSTATAVAITTNRAGVFSIQEIRLTNAGFGYTETPTIYIEGGGGTGAAATCSIETIQSGVISLSVDDGGSGYVTPPTVTITRPDVGATATATVGSSGTITAFTITDTGSAYALSPTVTVSTPTRSGVLDSIRSVNAGSGYQANETVRLVPNNVSMGGTEAIIRIDSVNGSGGVTGFTTVYGGYDFEVSSNPSNDFYEARDGSGNDNFRLVVDSVTTSIGTTATGTAVVSAGGSITSIAIVDAGNGYTKSPHADAPTVTISNEDQFKDPAVERATAVAGISTGGIVTAIRITNPGYGYSSTPSVTIAAPPTVSGVGTYQFNEEVVGSSSGTRARVKEWDDTTNSLKVSNVSGTFTNGEILVGAASSATFAIKQHDERDLYDKYTENDEIESEADLILDFTQSNPFGNY